MAIEVNYMGFEQVGGILREYFKDLEIKDLEKKNPNIFSVINKVFMDHFIKCIDDPKRCGLNKIEDYPQLFSRDITLDLHEIFRCGNKIVKERLLNASKYLDLILENAKSIFKGVVVFNGKLTSRLVINTRYPGLPLNISISWDPFLDLPYIPSSAIKGVVRDYLETNKSELSDIDNIEIDELLGSRDRIGLLVFFDSFPVKCSSDNYSLIEPEILTPHYIEAEGRIDEASSSPRPLTYPTIAPSIEFRFIIAYTGLVRNTRVFSESKWNRIIRILQDALESGIGAKTSLGYGYFKIQRVSKYP